MSSNLVLAKDVTPPVPNLEGGIVARTQAPSAPPSPTGTDLTLAACDSSITPHWKANTRFSLEDLTKLQ
jgi:hypothetical protein